VECAFLVAAFTSASIEETLDYVHADDRDSEEYISEVVARGLEKLIEITLLGVH
jgi:hypothetical protein